MKSFGLPRSLAWGFLGILIFTMGVGIEQTWLSKYIQQQGMDNELLFTVYGIAVAISSWLSGVIAETVGVRRTMTIGYLLFAVGMALFAGVGMTNMNYPILVATYAVKGLAYPLFAYTFIVWITYRVDKSALSTAQGWFWVMCTGGMDVLGAYYGAFAKTEFGVVTALWTAVAFASVGAAMALWLNRSEDKNLFAGNDAAMTENKDKTSKIKELVQGLSIIKDEPKVLMGGIVRMINTLSYFAFLVFMPLYLMSYGIDDSQWATIWGAAFFCNIIFNLVFGVVGDRIGWGRTVKFFGCGGCAASVLLFYYSPMICNEFWFILLCGCLWGVLLAGFVPVGALVPSLVEKRKGAAVSVLNLGAGMAAFVGPLLVKLLKEPLGYEGIVWTLAGIYLVGGVMTHYISKEKRE